MAIEHAIIRRLYVLELMEKVVVRYLFAVKFA